MFPKNNQTIEIQSTTPFFHAKKEGKYGDVTLDREFFKRSVCTHYAQIYKSRKWQNHFYRCIFFGLSSLFFVLGIMIFFKTCNFTSGLYFSYYCSHIKNLINFSCLIFSTAAFAFGYKIQPEKEALGYLVGKVEKELKNPPKELQMELNSIFSNLASKQLAAYQKIIYQNSSYTQRT